MTCYSKKNLTVYFHTQEQREREKQDLEYAKEIADEDDDFL